MFREKLDAKNEEIAKLKQYNYKNYDEKFAQIRGEMVMFIIISTKNFLEVVTRNFGR